MLPDDRATVLVIGIGNRYRNDDSAGLLAAQLVRARALPAVKVIEHESEGAALVDLLAGAEAAILIDAVRSGTARGTIQRFDVCDGPLPAEAFRHSTHAFDVASALELARALSSLPPRVIVYGIEGGNFGAGTRISAEIAAALPELVERVISEVENLQRCHTFR